VLLTPPSALDILEIACAPVDNKHDPYPDLNFTLLDVFRAKVIGGRGDMRYSV
jgi:hypothetical protein